jgi:hypothetical protein
MTNIDAGYREVCQEEREACYGQALLKIHIFLSLSQNNIFSKILSREFYKCVKSTTL